MAVKQIIRSTAPWRVSLGSALDVNKAIKHPDAQWGLGVAFTLGSHGADFTVYPKSEGKVLVYYGKTEEEVSRATEVRHEIIREALKIKGIDTGIEVHCHVTIPSSKGTGLSSSTAFGAGLLVGFDMFVNGAEHIYTKEQLYKDTRELERRLLLAQALRASKDGRVDVAAEEGKLGQQDPAAIIWGGLVEMKFYADERVPEVRKKELTSEEGQRLSDSLILVPTNMGRQSFDPLGRLASQSGSEIQKHLALRSHVENLVRAVDDRSILDPNILGPLLEASWPMKRGNPAIDGLHEMILKAGGLGGRLVGAGDGGFLLEAVPEDASVREKILGQLGDAYSPMDFNIGLDGARAWVEPKPRSYPSKRA